MSASDERSAYTTPAPLEALSERDRHMAHEIGRHAGQHVVARLMDLATDREFAGKVTGTYAEEAQRIVGAAVIRFFVWVVGIAMLIVAWKTGVISAVNDLFKTGP